MNAFALDTRRTTPRTHTVLLALLVALAAYSGAMAIKPAQAEAARALPMAQIRSDASQVAGILGRRLGVAAEYSCAVNSPEYAICNSYLYRVRHNNGSLMNCTISYWVYYTHTYGWNIGTAPNPAGTRCVYVQIATSTALNNQVARNVVVNNLSAGWFRNIYRTPSLVF